MVISIAFPLSQWILGMGGPLYCVYDVMDNDLHAGHFDTLISARKEAD